MPRRVSVLLALLALLAASVGLPTGEMCLETKDRDTCNSRVCPGYAWCEMCDKCLYAELAVYKDEL